MPEVGLAALDGTNPLAFLASLGVLAATANQSSGGSIRWAYEGRWFPVLLSDLPDLGAVVDALDADRLDCMEDEALALAYDGKRDLKPPPGMFVDYLKRLVETCTPSSRRSVDWAAAFATDIAVDHNGNTKPTALHFTAGQQQFLQMCLDLVNRVTKEDLEEALEGPWLYDKPLPVLGWDGTASRDYALRADDPSTDKKLGVPGADWLAIRGLGFLPTFPIGNRINTTACRGGWKDGHFRWPLWTVPLRAPVVRCLLAQDLESLSRRERTARGVGAVFCSGIRRSDQGGYGSFEPATVL